MTRDAQIDRNIFRFNDGERDRAADPFRVVRQLQHNGKFDLKTYADLADAGQEPESSEFFALLHRVFGTKPFDEETNTGMTDWEVSKLFEQFCVYLEELKKNSSLGLTSSQPTGSESSTSPEPPSPPTSEPLDSTSAGSESDFASNGV